MIAKEIIPILTEFPADIQFESVTEEENIGERYIISAKTAKDFRRFAGLYGTEVEIFRNLFPRVSGGVSVTCWFQTEDARLRFRWCGKVNGYTVRWRGQNGKQWENYFRDLENAKRTAKECREQYGNALLLPGTDGDPE